MLSSFIAVWAETGEFRDNSHSVMTSVAGSMDHSHLNFQTAASRNRSRDRKNDGQYYLFIYLYYYMHSLFFTNSEDFRFLN